MSVKDKLETIRQYLANEDPSEPDPRDAEIDRLRSLLAEAVDALSYVTCELVGTGCEYVADKVDPVEVKLRKSIQ